MTIRSINTSGLPQGVLTPMGDLLFAASEPGAWYDPSDLSTLFQDTAGTTPVTAVEQAVALMLDKSGRGNHASQATSTKRPKYSRRVNLIPNSNANISWEAAPTSFRYVLAPNGLIEAVVPTHTAAGSDRWYFSIPANTYPNGTVLQYSYHTNASYGSGGLPSAYFPIGLSLGSVTSVVSTNGFVRWFVTVTVTDTASTQVLRNYISPTPNVESAAVWGHDLRPATDAHLPYQRVNTATDYDADPAKFPAYLRFDGVDDALQTGNIDFTGTDKMTVWAGVTKLSDAATGMLAELSTGLVGSFYVAAPQGAAATYNVRAGGTTLIAATSPANYAAPITSVLTGIDNISGDSVILRINGSQVAATALDQGTGNYGNYPLYIGARAGTSLFFNGRLYQLIVRGAQSSLSQIEAAELYIRRRMMLP